MNKSVNKILLVAINAKYIQSSLAVRSLYAYLSEEEKKYVEVLEFTINQSEDLILSEIVERKPAILAFSCYIWNVDLIREIVSSFSRIKPDIPIIIGGPEVSYYEHYHDFFYYSDDVNYVIVKGEGEEIFKAIVQNFMSGKEIYTLRNRMVTTFAPMQLQLEDIPFPYDSANSFKDLENRLIYYESSRGCISKCAFCLAPTTGKVRFLPVNRVKEDLLKFLSANVKQVKFVDRTFNCNRQRAMDIWKFLIENDNNITNFHFEIDARLLDHEQILFLSQIRKGLFQFEIGIQSTNPATLSRSWRHPEPPLSNTKLLREANNIHLHLDLIVGLPLETLKSFRKSFNDVMGCYPNKLQVGFLKMLQGCEFYRLYQERKNPCGVILKNKPPYEVIKTSTMSFEEINHIKKIETMVDIFYNGKGFECSVKYLMFAFHTPYDFFDILAIYWHKNKYHLVSHKKFSLYTILYEFCKENGFIVDNINQPSEICELLKFDMLLQDNIRTFPPWIESYYSYDSKQVTRTTAIHSFDYDVYLWLEMIPFKQNGKATASLSEGSVAGVSPAEWRGLGQSPIKTNKIYFDYSKQDEKRCHTL